MRRSRELISLPVISLEEGRQLGFVKGLVVDPAEKKVAALAIEQKGLFKEQRFLPFAKIKSIGSDAVTVDRSTGAEKGAKLPDIVRLLKDRVEIHGAKLVAENGSALGFVDEYFVDEETGKIAGLEFAGNFIDSVIKGRAYLDAAFVRTIGKEVVVVAAGGSENVLKLDGGLQDTVKTIKDSTGQILENTFQKTKELGSNLNKSLEKVKREIKSRRGAGEENGEAVGLEEEKAPAPRAAGDGKEVPGSGEVLPPCPPGACGCGEHKAAAPPEEGGPPLK
ncbi:MAG: PRC-barrel domain-containing protein [Firmicutes bacterium]|nr:PRC-barrel domain-containing protein [Bacillota bacterium]